MDEKKFEEKIEEIVKKVEEKIHNIGDIVDERIKEHLVEKEAKNVKSNQQRRNHEFWGIILLVFGFIFLAENMNWIQWDVPLIPLAMVAIGIYLIFVR